MRIKTLLIVIFGQFLISCVHSQSNVLASQVKFQEKQAIVTVTKNQEGILIQGQGAAYIYYYKNKHAVFMANAMLNRMPAVIIAPLDQNDKPTLVIFRFTDKNGENQEVPIPKSDKPGIIKLYKDVENVVATFIKENKVKDILRENGIK